MRDRSSPTAAVQLTSARPSRASPRRSPISFMSFRVAFRRFLRPVRHHSSPSTLGLAIACRQARLANPARTFSSHPTRPESAKTHHPRAGAKRTQITAPPRTPTPPAQNQATIPPPCLSFCLLPFAFCLHPRSLPPLPLPLKLTHRPRAGVAELADAQVLGACTERCRGSTPLSCIGV
jgi:hypothetical protein